jgi:hypothetical protein
MEEEHSKEAELHYHVFIEEILRDISQSTMYIATSFWTNLDSIPRLPEVLFMKEEVTAIHVRLIVII